MKRLLRSFLVAAARRIAGILQEAQGQAVRSRLRSCGEGVEFHAYVAIAGPEGVTVGNGVSLGPFVHIWGQGGVLIGDRVMIGSHVAITSLTHDHNQHPMQATVVKRPVVIEDDAWIGAHAVVMPGITIGRGAVVGAGAVVTRDVEPFAVVAGLPASLLKRRNVVSGDTTGLP